MKQKLFTLLTLALFVCSGAWADTTFKCKLNGSFAQERNDGSADPFFSISFSSGSYGWKSGSDINGCTYDGVNYTSALKFDSKPTLSFTTTQSATIIAVIDTKNMSSSESITGAKIWTTTNVAAGSHTIKKGGSEIYIYCVYVIYPAPAGDYTITKGTATNGSITVASSANENDVVDIEATPNTGYSFNGWDIYKTADAEIKISPAEAIASTTFTMPAYDVTVDASFTAINYDITRNAVENGTYTIKVGDAAAVSTNTTANYGQTITLAATPADGYALSAWNVTKTTGGDAVTMETANTFVMPAAAVTIAPTFVAAAAPTISVDATSLSTPQNVSVELTATATGSPAPTVTWYQSATAVASGGTEKATGTSYSPAVTTIGTYYFYAVASNGIDPDAVSDVITVTVAPKLNSLVYSNGFKAFIQQPGAGNGTVKAYYIAGTDAPTISSFTATTGATYNVVGNTLTLTAADGETTAVYDITLAPVTPYSGTGEYTFTAGDSWVKAGNNFSSGWKIARSYENDSEGKFMVSTGTNRVYLFMAPSTSLTVTQSGTNRDMLVSIDGGDAIEKSAATTFTFDGNENAAYMVEIAQKNSNGGDGKITKVAVTKTGFESGIISASGWNTFSSSSKLDLSQVTGGTAYVATSTSGSSVTLTSVDDKIVEAEEGLMIKGTAGAAFKIATTTDAATFEGDNLLVGLPSGGTVAKAGTGCNYVFGWADPAAPGFYLINGESATLGAGKAYLHTTGELTEGRLAIVFDEEGDVTGVTSVAKPQTTNNASFYDLQGRRVAQPTKGLYIMNGKKVIIK